MKALTRQLAETVVTRAAAQSLKVTTAESCTGGLVSAALTSISGSSAMFARGYVTYANEAKEEMLGVNGSTLNTHGAVSHQVAEEMARGALARSGADIAISITGIAGPTGGSARKPVGLVWFGLATASRIRAERRVFANVPRDLVRERAVDQALRMLLHGIGDAT